MREEPATDRQAPPASPPADPAVAVGQQFGMGGLLQTWNSHRYPPVVPFGWAGWGVSVIILITAVVTGSGMVALLSVAVFAASVVLLIVGWSRRKVTDVVARYQGGFAQMKPGTFDARVVRWDIVTELGVSYQTSTSTVSNGNGGTVPVTTTVISGLSARPALTQSRLEAARMKRGVPALLVSDALRAAGPRLCYGLTGAFDAGMPVDFGGIRLDQYGITFPARPDGRPSPVTGLVPWSEIRSVSGQAIRLPGRLRAIHTIGLRLAQRPRRVTFGLSGVPNGIFLPDLLRHAAARYGIPARL